jgi:hypothetical protein
MRRVSGAGAAPAPSCARSPMGREGAAAQRRRLAGPQVRPLQGAQARLGAGRGRAQGHHQRRCRRCRPAQLAGRRVRDPGLPHHQALLHRRQGQAQVGARSARPCPPAQPATARRPAAPPAASLSASLVALQVDYQSGRTAKDIINWSMDKARSLALKRIGEQPAPRAAHPASTTRLRAGQARLQQPKHTPNQTKPHHTTPHHTTPHHHTTTTTPPPPPHHTTTTTTTTPPCRREGSALGRRPRRRRRRRLWRRRGRLLRRHRRGHPDRLHLRREGQEQRRDVVHRVLRALVRGGGGVVVAAAAAALCATSWPRLSSPLSADPGPDPPPGAATARASSPSGSRQPSSSRARCTWRRWTAPCTRACAAPTVRTRASRANPLCLRTCAP